MPSHFFTLFVCFHIFSNVNVATNWKRTVKVAGNKQENQRRKHRVEGEWGKEGSTPELNKSFILGCSSSRKAARCKENKNQKKKRKTKNKLFKKNMFYINFCWRKGEQRTRKGEKENEERKQQVEEEEEEAVETTTNSAAQGEK